MFFILIDVIFNADILLEASTSHLSAAAPEYERNVEDMEYFNAGVLVMKYPRHEKKRNMREFILKMKNRKKYIGLLTKDI